MTAPVRAPQRRVVPVRVPLARPKRGPELRVVEPPTPRARVVVATVVGVGLIFVVLFGLVLFHTVLVQNQQRLDHIDSQVREEQTRYQRDRLEVARLEAPARIVDVATQRLQMVPPPGTSYLVPSGTTAAAVGSPAQQPEDQAKADQMDQTGSEWSTVKPQLGAAG